MSEKNEMSEGRKYSYSQSGVDIGKASGVLSQLKKTITSTFSDRVLSDLSSFSGLFRLDLKNYKDPVLTSSTDGVGTKILLAKRMNYYRDIGQDAVAMCLNDIICCGATPLFFLDYIACEKIDREKIKIIIESISGSCRYCSTVLLGGEMAEHPGMSSEDDIDIAGFAVGIVEREAIINPGLVKKGDIMVGISSSGVHSNGFSLIRRLVDDKGLDFGEKYKWTGGLPLGKLLLTPTKLYSRIIGRMIKNKIEIHGIAHITGGGFYENINRIIPDDMDASIREGSWRILPVFEFFRELGNIDREEMFRVFNMGIGMVIIVSPDQFNGVSDIARKMKENVYNIGTIIPGNGRVIIKEN